MLPHDAPTRALVVLDSALHASLLQLAVIRAAAKTARGQGAAQLRQIVAFASALADSGLETVLRMMLELLECAYTEQVGIRGVGTVDFLVDGWLLIEGDGYEFHSDRDDYRRDRRRGNGAVERGLAQLRFSWEDVYFRPMEVLRQIARVLALGPPRRS